MVILGPIYTKCQCRCSFKAAMTLGTQLSLTTIEALENGVTTHFGATPNSIVVSESYVASVIAALTLH